MAPAPLADSPPAHGPGDEEAPPRLRFPPPAASTRAATRAARSRMVADQSTVPHFSPPPSPPPSTHSLTASRRPSAGMRATPRHSADLPQPVLIDSDGSESSQSESPRMVRHTSVASSEHRHQRRPERPQDQRQADDARVRAHEARLDELQAQLAHVVSILSHLRPRKHGSNTKGADHFSDYDSDASSASSATSQSTSVADAPPSIERKEDSPPAARPSPQRRRQSSRAPGVRVHPTEPTAPPSEQAPPSVQPPGSTRPLGASTSQTAPERLAKADLCRLSTALEPSRVHRWIEELIQTYEDYSTDAAWLLRLPAPAARLALEENAFLRPLDRWAARQAINTFKVDAPYVQLLMHDSSEAAVTARTSGVELLEYVKAKAAITSGESSRLRVAQFDTKVYFKPSMDIPTTHLNANELRNDFLALPAERTAAPNGLLRAVLMKLPSSVATQVAALEDKLVEAEALGKPPPWTFDELVYVSAQHILVAARRATTTTHAQVNALETKGRKDSTAARTGPIKCPCCGKQGHLPRDCPTTCKECKQRSCPGNYGSQCVVLAPVMPDAIANAFGKPIPPNIKAFLSKARQIKHGHQSQQQGAARQANAVEALTLSEQNAHVWEIMDDAGRTANVLLATKIPGPTSPSADPLFEIAKEACPTFKAVDGSIVRVAPRMIMMDGGSNINLFNHKDVPRLGTPLPGAPVQVSGWSDAESHSVLTSYRVDLQLKFNDEVVKRVTTQVAYSEHARRDILSESTMWDEHMWSVLKEPVMRVDTPRGSIPLLRINGVYFVEALVLPPRPPPASSLAETNALSAKRDGALHLSRLWAARLHVGSAALRRQLPACTGMGVEQLTAAMAKVADQDILNKRSNSRRPFAPRSSSAQMKPGELLIFDAFGPIAAQSVLDASHYELEAVCACTGYGYEVSSHSLTQQQWLGFIASVLASERSLGHIVLRLRFDRAPNLHADSFQQAVHLQFNVALEFAGRHEGIGAVEQRNDQKQRIAEADLMRAERTQSYLLPARIYAGWRINRRVAEGSTKTRFELHTGRRPDLSDPVPYIFGVACSVLEDENERGPKGAGCSLDSLHKGRTSSGIFVGIAGRSYKVRLDRGVTVERRHITPHDEHVLLLRGVPSSAVSVDASTSTNDHLQQLAPPTSRISSSSEPARPQSPPSSRTRARQAISATVSLVEAHLAAAPLATLSQSFDDALFQFRPDAYDSCAALPLDDARLLLLRSPPLPPARIHECCKATADVVQVQTDIGIQEYRVPATHLARERAPDALQWRQADEAALQVLLNTQSRDGRRNVLVPISKPASLGQPLIPSVLQRRIKTDPVTKKLIKRKSRLCVSGDRQKILQQQAGTYFPRQAHADSADDVLIKMVLAASAATKTKPRMRRIKLDIGNAYSRGIRRRPPAYMKLGKSLARVSDTGEELCLELHTPTYGEEPSGDDWGETFDVDIVTIGWESAEAVPALYYFVLPGGDARAYFIRVVDDVLIVFPPQCPSVAENTIACFKKFYHDDVSVEWDPTSFVGYAILDDVDTGAVTLNMASHVEHAVRQYLPGLLQSPPVRPSASLSKGQSFQSLADSLQHHPATKPLEEHQTRVQRMIGAMRYPEKVLPVLTLGLHRLSCVAQNPPPVATLVAELLLEVAYDHRFEGLTYGGSAAGHESDGLQFISAYGIEESSRPPDELVGYGDATWAAGLQNQSAPLPPLATLSAEGNEIASRDLYSVVLTFRGAAILHQTKKLALLVDCSMAAEEVATSKAAEYAEYASQIARALGLASGQPVPIGTDNASNKQVAMRQGASARSKHLLRRYYVLMQRVRAGEIRVVHVKDEANPADFLTKWVPARKLRSSVAYVSGQGARRKDFVRQAIMRRRASSSGA